MLSRTVFLAIFLAGCAIEPVKFSGPNGRAAYAMTCSGPGRTIEACYQKAGDMCPSGYDIVSQPTPPVYNLAIECR